MKPCKSCGKKTKSSLQYCKTCFDANADGVKSAYYKKWWDKKGKEWQWERRGVKATTDQKQRHDAVEDCDICETYIKSSVNKVLDHCHDTGEYRGTICRTCNTAIGLLGDDLNNIIERLEKYREQTHEV